MVSILNQDRDNAQDNQKQSREGRNVQLRFQETNEENNNEEDELTQENSFMVYKNSMQE